MTDKKVSSVATDDKIHDIHVVTPQVTTDIDKVTGDTKRMAELHNDVRKVLFPTVNNNNKEKEKADNDDIQSDDNDSDFDFVKPRASKIAKTNIYSGARYSSASGGGKWSLKVYAERLQGQLVLITARYRAKHTSDYNNHGYIFHAVKACESQSEEFEIFQKFHLTDILLSVCPNSDEQLEGEDGYLCYGLIMFVPKGTTDKSIYDYIDDLAIWMCNHSWSRSDSCVVHGSKFGKWRVDPNDWNETRSPKRKLGQIATVSSACRALTGFDNDLFSKNFYQTRPKLASKYFDHPYSKQLYWCFGFPKEEEE
jgi:hypothetical protein